jgi:glycosyltransferase involved in cell wall biosynthesis
MHRDSSFAPLVTVAMVTYNSARYITEAIESVLAQEFEDFELLICDDCSRDDTWEIASRYSDSRIRAVRNDFNMGEYLNRNQALRLARGKYIMFLDGDDFLYPHGLGFMVKMMESFPKAAFASAHEPSEKFIYPVEFTPHEFCACAFLGPVVVGNNFKQLIFRTENLRPIDGCACRLR